MDATTIALSVVSPTPVFSFKPKNLFKRQLFPTEIGPITMWNFLPFLGRVSVNLYCFKLSKKAVKTIYFCYLYIKGLEAFIAYLLASYKSYWLYCTILFNYSIYSKILGSILLTVTYPSCLLGLYGFWPLCALFALNPPSICAIILYNEAVNPPFST